MDGRNPFPLHLPLHTFAKFDLRRQSILLPDSAQQKTVLLARFRGNHYPAKD